MPDIHLAQRSARTGTSRDLTMARRGLGWIATAVMLGATIVVALVTPV